MRSIGWFVRSRGGIAALAFVAGSVLCAFIASGDMDAVPLLPTRALVELVWLSCLPPILATLVLAPASHERERTWPTLPAAAWRLGWALFLAILPGLLALLALWLRGDSLWWALWFWRNHLLLFGAGLCLSQLLPPRASWVPLATYALLCWFLGTSDSLGTPQTWALVHYLPEEATPLIVTGTLLLIGLAAQWLRPSRSDMP